MPGFQLVRGSASPGLCAGSRYSCALSFSERSERKYSHIPSGDHRGIMSSASPLVSRRASVDPSVDTSQISLRVRSSRRPTGATTKATTLPSGEIRGSEGDGASTIISAVSVANGPPLVPLHVDMLSRPPATQAEHTDYGALQTSKGACTLLTSRVLRGGYQRWVM